jgi:hypothetical protein
LCQNCYLSRYYRKRKEQKQQRDKEAARLKDFESSQGDINEDANLKEADLDPKQEEFDLEINDVEESKTETEQTMSPAVTLGKRD